MKYWKAGCVRLSRECHYALLTAPPPKSQITETLQESINLDGLFPNFLPPESSSRGIIEAAGNFRNFACYPSDLPRLQEIEATPELQSDTFSGTYLRSVFRLCNKGGISVPQIYHHSPHVTPAGDYLTPPAETRPLRPQAGAVRWRST